MLRRYERWIDLLFRYPSLNFAVRLLTLVPIILPLALVEIYLERPWDAEPRPQRSPAGQSLRD